MKKSLACKSCGGKTKMKVGGNPGDKIKRAENKNAKAKALGYESWAAMKDAKRENRGSRAQNASIWSGVASSLLGSVLLGKEALKKEKRGGTTKRKAKR